MPLDIVKDVIKEKQAFSEQTQAVIGKEKKSFVISIYDDLKAFLLQ